MHNLNNMRMLIAEDHALVRQGIVALMAGTFGECTEVENGVQAAKLLKTRRYDIALLDIGLPRRSGVDVLTDIRKREIPVKIIIMTGNTDAYSPQQIYKKGADGFVYKTSDAARFMDTVVSVAKGVDVYDREMREGNSAAAIAITKDLLTNRELQIVKLVVEGHTNKIIAKNLFISEHTVRKHREHINQKLSIRSPVALASFAIKSGLV